LIYAILLLILLELCTYRKSKLRGDSAGDEFYKLVLNGSYGYDIINVEKFSKCSIHNKHTAALKIYSPYFMSARKLNENRYQVQMK
jgi:hypothetical protein